MFIELESTKLNKILDYTWSVMAINSVSSHNVGSNFKVLVIIPAFNESASILDTVKSIESYGYDYIVVNDGSSDNTLEICLENNVNVLNLSQNLGIGGAIQAGHKFAYEHNYDIDIQVDGDGQHDPAFIPDLVDQIAKGSNLAIGSRFLVRTDGFQSSFMRRVGIKWLCWWIKLFTGKIVTDPTSGFRACDSKAIALFCKYYPDDYPEPESIVVALKDGLRVSESSVLMRERQGGVSSIGVSSSVYYMIKVSLAILFASLTSAKRG